MAMGVGPLATFSACFYTAYIFLNFTEGKDDNFRCCLHVLVFIRIYVVCYLLTYLSGPGSLLLSTQLGDNARANIKRK